MECCMCDKEIDLDKKGEYDFVGDLWCKECMEKEVNREM